MMSPNEESPVEQKLIKLTESLTKKKGYMFYLPVSKQKGISGADRPESYFIWANRTLFPAPKSNDLLNVVKKATVDLSGGESVDAMNDISTGCTWQMEKLEKFSGLDTGLELRMRKIKFGANRISARKRSMKDLMSDLRDKTTIFCIGGGFYLTAEPTSIRPITRIQYAQLLEDI